MDKHEFMNILRKAIRALPEGVRMDILADYETHFAFGLQGGKTEEEIARELGDPDELAQEMLADYKERVSSMQERVVFTTRTVFSLIGLIFLNLILVVPVAAVLGSAWLAISVCAIAGTVSPLLAVADFVLNQSFSGLKLSVAFAMSGVGMLLLVVSYFLGKILLRTLQVYIRWNVHVLKGVE